MRVGQNVFYEAIASIGFGIGEPVKNTIPFRVFDPVIQVALFLVAKRCSVADEKLKIACIGLVDGRVIDFIDDAVAEREPNPTARMIRSAQTLLGAGGPAGLNSRGTKGNAVSTWIHLSNHLLRTSAAFRILSGLS